MSNPKTVRLGEIVTVNPRVQKGHGLTDDQDVGFLAMADISEEGHIFQVQQRSFKDVSKGYTPFQNGDVLLAKITPCFENGKATVVSGVPSEWGFGSTEFHVLRPSKEIDGRYLFHLVWNEQFRINGSKNMTGSAGQKRVPTSFIDALEVELPPIDKQKRIAAILDKADSIRRKRREALTLADDFLRAAFLEMFGDLEANNCNWSTTELGSIITHGPTNGLYVPSTQYGSGTPILRIDGFYEGEILPNYKYKRVAIDQAVINKFEIKENSIIINRVNSKEYVGKAALISQLEETTVFESNMMNLCIDTSKADLAFVVYQLGLPYLRNQIATARKDAVNQSSINQQDVKNLKFRLPPRAQQDKFSAIHQKVSAIIKARLTDKDTAERLSINLQNALISHV